jgi:hypothetical protein
MGGQTPNTLKFDVHVVSVDLTVLDDNTRNNTFRMTQTPTAYYAVPWTK